MIDDSPENMAVYVITPKGETPEREELDAACRFSYNRAYKTKDLCTSAGNCMLHVQHTRSSAEDGMYDVDEYALVCDPGCPLLSENFIDKDVMQHGD